MELRIENPPSEIEALRKENRELREINADLL